MPITEQDLYVAHLETVVRTAQACLKRAHDPDAPDWQRNPVGVVSDLGGILRAAEFAPAYPSLGVFVRDHIAKDRAREVVHSPIFAWCPEWWEHGEAVRVFGLLWRGYENIRAAGGDADALSDHELHHIGPHLRELMDPTGPFKYCSVRHGHKDMLEPMYINFDAAPPGLFADRAAIASVA